MYYSSGNYEAFAQPLKPEGIENKRAWIVGSGLAGLSTAAFLVRDAQMPGRNTTILEELGILGGALDGIKEPERTSSYAAAERWNPTSNVSGTCFGRSLRSRKRMLLSWTSFTG